MAKSTKMRARTIKQNMKHVFFVCFFLEVAMPLFECQGRFFLLVNNVLNQLSLIFDKKKKHYNVGVIYFICIVLLSF